MMAKKIVITMTILLLAVPFCFARAKRPNQIPNGTKFSCLNCHFGQGGVRNTFGQMVESGYLTVPGADGDVVWGNALALLEADGDGFSNGTELQDPDGTWSRGRKALCPGVWNSTKTIPILSTRRRGFEFTCLIGIASGFAYSTSAERPCGRRSGPWIRPAKSK
jgi:hypothetical protein